MMRDIRLELNRFTIEDILMQISDFSKEILISGNDETPINNAKMFSYRYGKYKQQSFLVSNWILLDMAYYAIKNVSDAFTKYPFDKEKFIELIHLFINYENSSIHQLKQEELHIYLHGFLGEQQLFQSYHKVKENYCRERYILEKMDINEEIEMIVNEEVGVDSSKLPIILYYLFLVSFKTNDILNNLIQLKGIDRSDIENVINYYSKDLDYIRSSPLKRQQLYSTPFIQFKDSSPFAVNAFLNYYVMQNCFFWVLRNHYKKKSSQKFINAFGNAFEDYIRVLLSQYIDSSSYVSIPVAECSRADFMMSLGQYDFLIEAKSSLAGLLAKQQNSDINTTKTFMERTILEAVTQLKSSEEHYNRKFIKIILVYEEYYRSEILGIALNRDNRFVDDGSYWLINISEFEKMLWTFKYNYELFVKVMETKIQYEVSRSLDGRDLEQILGRFDIIENPHIQQERFTRYFTDIDDYFNSNAYIKSNI